MAWAHQASGLRKTFIARMARIRCRMFCKAGRQEYVAPAMHGYEGSPFGKCETAFNRALVDEAESVLLCPCSLPADFIDQIVQACFDEVQGRLVHQLSILNTGRDTGNGDVLAHQWTSKRSG